MDTDEAPFLPPTSRPERDRPVGAPSGLNPGPVVLRVDAMPRLYNPVVEAVTMRGLYDDCKLVLLLPPGASTVGRSAECDFTLSGTTLSRTHCTLYLSEWSLIIEDSGSTHGVGVNGILKGQSPLRVNDEVQLGDVVLRVEIRAIKALAYEENLVMARRVTGR